MLVLPPKVRSQVTALGTRSRPLGEARAQQLAAGLVLALVQEARGGGDLVRVVSYYEGLIDREVANRTVTPKAPVAAKRPASAMQPSWADLLPEHS